VTIFIRPLFYAKNCAHVGYYAASSGNSLHYHFLLCNNIEEPPGLTYIAAKALYHAWFMLLRFIQT